MPYIKQEKREAIINSTFDEIDCAGDLNFVFTWFIKRYIKKKGLNYQTINDVIGALVCCKDEFQRRVTGNYEDIKIQENGDVLE